MKIGRSGVYRCDFCGNAIVGEPDMTRRSGKELHFCEAKDEEGKKCLDRHDYETRYRDLVVTRVEVALKAEFKLIYDRVCPSCRFRLRALV